MLPSRAVVAVRMIAAAAAAADARSETMVLTQCTNNATG